MKKFVLALVVLGTLLALPALYAASFVYGKVDGSTDVFRVNRFTGKKEFATDYGWETQREMMLRAESELKADVEQFKRAVDRIVAVGPKKIVDVTWNGSLLSAKLADGSTIEAQARYNSFSGDLDGAVRHRLNTAGISFRFPDERDLLAAR